MDPHLLAEADRIVSSLSPGKRETVREIVVDATQRGGLNASARRYLETVSGSAFLADVLVEALGSAHPDLDSLLG